MAASGFFSDPWDTDDAADAPQPFFGSLFKDWPSPLGGNFLTPLPAPHLFPGSLAPPGDWALKVSSPTELLAASATAPSPISPGAAPDQMGATPPLGPVPEEIKVRTGQEADTALQKAGQLAGLAGQTIGLVPGLEGLGKGITWFGRGLGRSFIRHVITNAIRDNVVNGIQAEINRVDNAYGQQQFINGGGMPHR